MSTSAVLRLGKERLQRDENERPASDEELARRARDGSEAAFALLVDRFQRPLYQFLWVRTSRPEDAEELVQETFLKAWRNLQRYDPTRRFATWLYTVAKRLAISHHRKDRGTMTAVEDVFEDCECALPRPEEMVSADEERLELWSLAKRVLGEEERSALWLRYGEDLSPGEIATILGRRRVSVRVLLFRAREKLARRLEDEYGGTGVEEREREER